MVVVFEEFGAGVLAGVALAEADEGVDNGYADGCEDIGEAEGFGVEVGADPGVVDDVADQEE